VILFWAAALALVMLLYVLLDGFDLGIGILSAFARDDRDKRRMLMSIAPVWDGNETWLVIAATILFGAFPKVYAAVLAAFYLPVVLMLGALILRGVAFEFRDKATGTRWIWDFAFAGGSCLASFLQGVAVGELVQGFPLVDGRYAGGPLHWLNPFALLCGGGLCLGYALLGAAWLVRTCEEDLQKRAYGVLPWLLASVLAFLVAVFLLSVTKNLPIMQRWLERPYLAIFPLIGLAAVLLLAWAIRSKRYDALPFGMAATIFIAAFGTLTVSFWPYMIPFGLTVDQAASPPASLNFMFWGAGIFALPITLGYTLVVYAIFGGKCAERAEEY
jgi:cytochrome d ubiquinol oxidase subunit II